MTILANVSSAIDFGAAVAEPEAIGFPDCNRGIGTVVQTTGHPGLIQGVHVEAFPVWPDDRGHFVEVLRVGRGLAADFPPTTTQELPP